jgi:protein-L-isoaspartate(D-aspartate) O-methyltransferase
MLKAQASEQMIEQQVRAWSVLDERVLAVLREVPRELFVPPDQQFLAFADAEVPLPQGQHMLRPSVAGRLLQSLDLEKTDRVLEIGAGSGFVTACLAVASERVRAVEIFPELAQMALRNVQTLGIRNVEVMTQDATTLDTGERYNAIALTASVPMYDPRFQLQLEIGGRLFVVVGEAPAMEARLVRRIAENEWREESLFETVVDPLINAQRPEEFVF